MEGLDLYQGIICVNKPADFTSFDVVAKLRGICKQKKIGHGGTLDPMATGVLPVFLGRCTRACDIVPIQDKAYRATVRLGLVTDTQDTTGRVLEETAPQVTRSRLEEVLASFRGEMDQLPPMYSAVKVNGVRLYKLARKGDEVERPTRRITVYRLELEEFDQENQTFAIQVHCSKGTYIRTLCHDIGRALGCGAAMDTLIRTQAMGFSLEECYSFSEIQQAADEGRLAGLLQPVERVFLSYPAVELDGEQTKKILNGARLDLERLPPLAGETVRVRSHTGRFLGLARPDRETGELVVVKLLAGEDDQ